MSLQYSVLGAPGRDNALLVRVETGQAVYRLLFDCGEGCLNALPISEVHAIDALFFSHLHLDHIAGFDSFLRHNYNRGMGVVDIYGPGGTAARIQHRLLGTLWNLVEGQAGVIRVTDVEEDQVRSARLFTSEGFATLHEDGARPFDGTVLRTPDFTVKACLLDHGTPCLAYCVRETARVNVDTEALARQGLRPGRWMQALKDTAGCHEEFINVEGTPYRTEDLRRELLVTTPGQSVAYLTDFTLDTASEERLADMLAGCQTIICENNFRDADAELAARSRHLTSSQVGRLAARVRPEKLILFHLSDRYRREEWLELLAEVRAIFPETYFPENWTLSGED